MRKFLHDFRPLIYCICELAVGVLLLIDPIAFTSAIVRILGIVLCVFGVLNIMNYFRLAPEMGSMSMSFTKGLVQVIAAVFCIFRPDCKRLPSSGSGIRPCNTCGGTCKAAMVG